MKKIITAALTASLLLTLTACGSEPANLGGDVVNIDSNTESVNEVSEGADTTVATTGDGYSFTVNGVTFTVDMDASEVVSKLGDYDSYYEAPSCAFDGMEKTYTYSGYEIITYEDGDVDRIAQIILTNDLVSTEEGIVIGDEASKVDETYADPDSSDDRQRVFVKDGTKLNFILEDGKVISIEYDTLNGEQ